MKKKLLTLLLMPLLVVSCSKSDSENASPNSQPKEYQVEYRITASGYTMANIVYADASNTQVTEKDVPLPKTYTFKRTMKAADVVRVGAFPNAGTAAATVTCTILLDGKQVATNTSPGPDPQNVAIYQIP